jgi:hypothetical protein
MKGSTVLLIEGLVLAAFGSVVLVRGISVPEKHSVEIAGVEVSATESDPVPAWVGAGALIAGVLIGASGIAGRRSS